MAEAAPRYANVTLSDARVLRMLAEFSGAKTVLEFGTSTGYSGLWFANGLRKTGGRLMTFELSKEKPVHGWFWYKEGYAPEMVEYSLRLKQARTVLADAERWSGPVIVAGDFNGRAGAAELAGAGFTWLTEAVKNTLGRFDLDQIVARGLCPAGDEAAAAAEDETRASDHKPVWAVLAPCPGGPAGGTLAAQP